MHIDLMLDTLDGLSVGDASGQRFPVMARSVPDILAGDFPVGQWEWTDDTEMACGVAVELVARRKVSTRIGWPPGSPHDGIPVETTVSAHREFCARSVTVCHGG
ncbi:MULTISPECIES: hypothetical protein [Nocardia]|uniref:hypothetical protein n=1 Tax=Nocardia TaxID=1817 RepID=UPI001E487290|nr:MULTISPECIES: hypothetical protein [Nocardia]